MICHAMIFGLLFVGFWLLFGRIRWLELLRNLLRQTREGMDEAARKRLLSNRKNLLLMQQEYTLWYRLEQELTYSGLKRRLPFLTAENWLFGNVVIVAVVLVLGMFLTESWKVAVGIALLLLGVEYMVIVMGKAAQMRSVDDNLLKFLNFLGNYSITAGEVTGILEQVSRYVDEPIKSALVKCGYEAQTTGDTGMALLAMAEEIEHPKFKELARNMEISIRYCANFTALVDNSRRSVRSYLSMGEERKEMLRDAMINMLLLIGMSLFALITVDKLIDVSIWYILRYTLPGKIALGMVAVILFLLVRQLYKMK